LAKSQEKISMASDIAVPDAPKHLSDKAKSKWQKSYKDAFAKAQIDYPDNDSAQRTAANKSANAMLAVPAPQSAADIDKLDDWQVIVRETRTQGDGTQVKVCVTADGQKYSFPVPAGK
jgi:hypothetical protein